MRFRSVDRDLLVVSLLTVIAFVLALAVPPDIVLLRILTLPLVLILPGYALTSAMFPGRSTGMPERLVFSLGLSVVIVILGGLALNWTPSGLQASSWAVLLASITLGACAVALVRRRGQLLPVAGWAETVRVGLTLRQGLLLGLSAFIVCVAVTVSIVGASQQPRPGFTQLWMLPAAGANPKNAVRLGVSNMESTAMNYSLNVKVDGRVVKKWSSIILNPKEKWEAALTLPLPTRTTNTRVEALLYRADAPTTIYRDVVLWLGT